MASERCPYKGKGRQGGWRYKSKLLVVMSANPRSQFVADGEGRAGGEASGHVVGDDLQRNSSVDEAAVNQTLNIGAGESRNAELAILFGMHELMKKQRNAEPAAADEDAIVERNSGNAREIEVEPDTPQGQYTFDKPQQSRLAQVVDDSDEHDGEQIVVIVARECRTFFGGQRARITNVPGMLHVNPSLCQERADRYERSGDDHFASARSFLTMSLTDCGLAWPRVAFMTWPTKNLKTPSLPDLNLATLSGFLTMTSRAACSISASLTCAPRPSAVTISAALRPDANMVANTFFPMAPVIWLDSTSFTNSARAAGEIGLVSISLPESFNPRSSSVCIQLAAALPGAPAFTT